MNIMLKGVKYKEAKQDTPKVLEGIKFKYLET